MQNLRIVLSLLCVLGASTAQTVLNVHVEQPVPNPGAEQIRYRHATNGDVLVSALRDSSWRIFRVDRQSAAFSLVSEGKGYAIAGDASHVLSMQASSPWTAWVCDGSSSQQVWTGPMNGAAEAIAGKFVFCTTSPTNELWVTDGGPASLLTANNPAPVSLEDTIFKPFFWFSGEQLFVGNHIYDGTTLETYPSPGVQGLHYRPADFHVYMGPGPRIRRTQLGTVASTAELPPTTPQANLTFPLSHPVALPGHERRPWFMEGLALNNATRLYTYRNVNGATEIWRQMLTGPAYFVQETTAPTTLSQLDISPDGNTMVGVGIDSSSTPPVSRFYIWDGASWTSVLAPGPQMRFHMLGRTPTHLIAWARLQGPSVQGASLVRYSSPGNVIYYAGVQAENPAPNGASTSAQLGDKVLFTAHDATNGRQVWITDGTTNGTGMLIETYQAPTPPPAHSFPRGFHDLNGKAIFTAETPTTGRELYASDGTQTGTVLLGDLLPGPDDGVEELEGIALSDTFYFRGRDSAGNPELWMTDGTTAGTQLLHEIRPGNVGSDPGAFVALGAEFYFLADDGVHGRDLWVSDGTANGTRLAYDFFPGTAFDAVDVVATIGGRVIVQHEDLSIGAFEPATGTFQSLLGWPSNGGAQVITVDEHVRVGSDLILAVYRDGSEFTRRLWVTNGLPGPGSQSLGDASTYNATPRNHLTRFSNSCFLIRRTAAGPMEIVSTDGGTPAPLQMPPSVAIVSGPMAATQEHLFFFGFDPTSGWELHAYDGTTIGLVRDLSPGSASTDAVTMYAMASDRVVFRVENSPYGSETYVSDGTAAGTGLLWDANPGAANSLPYYYSRVGTDLYFRARSPTLGEEPHVLPLTSIDAPLAATVAGTLGCPGSNGLSPEFAFHGSPSIGNAQFEILWAQGPPNTPAILFLGDVQLPLPFPIVAGCNAYTLPFLSASTLTDGVGTAAVALPVPNDTNLVRLQLYLQAATVDPGAAGPFDLLSVTNLGTLLFGN